MRSIFYCIFRQYYPTITISVNVPIFYLLTLIAFQSCMAYFLLGPLTQLK